MPSSRPNVSQTTSSEVQTSETLPLPENPASESALSIPGFNISSEQLPDQQWPSTFLSGLNSSMELPAIQSQINEPIGYPQATEDAVVTSETFDFFWPTNDISGFGEGFNHGFDSFLRTWGTGTGRDNPPEGISPKIPAEYALSSDGPHISPVPNTDFSRRLSCLDPVHGNNPTSSPGLTSLDLSPSNMLGPIILQPQGFEETPEADLNFMKSQGCFHAPEGHVLLTMMKAYFLHVHPILPIISEMECWRLWESDNPNSFRLGRFSLFLLQAMLFTSCSFVPSAVITKAGFKTVREARYTFYRRAKLLFDFEVEKDTVCISQGALLLSYHAPNDNKRRTNTNWLSNAIRFARISGADRYNDPDLPREQQVRLKKLWWCCILRDRIMPLGLRRPLQITKDSFKCATYKPLDKEDFEDEIGYSKVYDEKTQLVLLSLLTPLCKLAGILTDVIMLAYPVDKPAISHEALDEEAFIGVEIRISECKRSLLAFYNEFVLLFPTPVGIGDTHPSLVLYINLLYIYYHSGVLAVCHHELFLSEMVSPLGVATDQYRNSSQRQIIDSVTGMMENMKEMVQLKLCKYMPISAAAYITLPWALHVLDVEVADSHATASLKRQRLQIFSEAMKYLQLNYDGTEYVSALIADITDFIQRDNLRLSKLEKVIRCWDDLLLQPKQYLRLVFHIDLALSTGAKPVEVDFPAELRQENFDVAIT
ncbi:fungal-specific transcription factor domain-containing protein [Xylogone sp. PMI_703]|nr:fungal-specific transcription factor domain-containing protein [Xylogone sp. PMI_703]